MTRQELRQRARAARKQKENEEAESSLLNKVLTKQREILKDPYRRNWNKYNCWNFRTIEGIEKDVADGWIFEIRDGQIFAINNPLVDKIKENIPKISYSEYEKIMESTSGAILSVEDKTDGNEPG